MIHLLTGPIRSGKTTALQQWAAGRDDVSGILTPDVNGQRVFLDIRSGEQFGMEAAPGETELLEIGRFVFSKRNFEKAIDCIYRSLDEKGWLIVDEIGPLELRESGFHSCLLDILASRTDRLLLVVREHLVQQVTEKYGLSAARQISADMLPSINE